jgi:hypothetical protein
MYFGRSYPCMTCINFSHDQEANKTLGCIRSLVSLAVSIIQQGVNSWNILRLENSRPETPRFSGKLKVRETAFSVNSTKMQKYSVFAGHDLASVVISSDVSGLVIITCKGLRYFYLWRWWFYVVSKCRNLIIEWFNIMLQENESWATLEQNSQNSET